MADAKKEEEIASSSLAVQNSSQRKENEEDEVDELREDACFAEFVPPPLVPLQHHLQKDKDDESLRRWKEKLLGCVEGDLSGQVEPEVTFASIGVMSEDLGENCTSLPLDESQSSKVLFSLREGTPYRFKLKFTVKHNIVSGLAYSNTVWRAGIQGRAAPMKRSGC